ncbi:MAG: phosphatidylglycerophosphatase A [Candidatus Marinimicrobia bacterium]|nr:phosphatidylglycerophosphatase A [Candidatus Neomarinimicrobiota bacterium]
MSGTYGSILGVLLFVLLTSVSFQIKIIILVFMFIFGAIAAAKIERQSGTEDNQIIVIDEIAGVWVTLLIAPEGIWWIAAALTVFRIMDISKPFPIKNLESVKSGYGVMLDDILAGVYAGVILLLVERFIL